MNVVVTGAAGYVGRRVIARLAADRRALETVLALDVRPVPVEERLPGIDYAEADVRSPELASIFIRREVDTVVHLASIVTPGRGMTRDVQHSVDVLGTQNVLEACAASGATHLVVTSSGAAYGYHADNPGTLSETAPLRGNDEFAYARHKRLVEEMLGRWRAERPKLRQLVLRAGTILGAGTSNQITDLFENRVILGIRGAASPFVFVWDEDVACVIAAGVHERREGIFNLAGDGAMTLREIAAHTGKPYVALPAGLLRTALRVLRRAGLTQYGPEQVDFIRYRPVLGNDALKSRFGYAPRLDSRQVFDLYWRSRPHARP